VQSWGGVSINQLPEFPHSLAGISAKTHWQEWQAIQYGVSDRVFLSFPFPEPNAMSSRSRSQRSYHSRSDHVTAHDTPDAETLRQQNAALRQQLQHYEAELGRLREIEQTVLQEQQQIDMTLRYQQAENRAILEALPDMMLRVRQDGFCLDFLPPIGESRDKYTPIRFHLAEVLPPDLLERQLAAIQQALTTRALQIYEHSFDKQGQLAHEEVRISAISDQEALIIVRDISDRKRNEAERQAVEDALRQSESELRAQANQLNELLQELQQTQLQLVQAEKMSSLGQLVAGIAHEINNPVGFIHGNLSHAHRYMQDLVELVTLYQTQDSTSSIIQERLADLDLEFLLSDVAKVFQSMETGVDRIRQIVQALRIFSHLDQAETKAVNLHQGLESALTLLQGRLTKPGMPSIEVIQQYDDLPLVECHAGELYQVFMHLLSNAIDALQEKAAIASPATWNPQLTIQTQALRPTLPLLDESDLLPSYVQIRIQDNGVGMSETVQQRIFDPFFTTKSVGQGLGMGLAISYQIITQKHHGAIAVQSTPNVGTEVILQIPVQPI
jgi:signal transduction histidine kinase